MCTLIQHFALQHLAYSGTVIFPSWKFLHRYIHNKVFMIINCQFWCSIHKQITRQPRLDVFDCALIRKHNDYMLYTLYVRSLTASGYHLPAPNKSTQAVQFQQIEELFWLFQVLFIIFLFYFTRHRYVSALLHDNQYKKRETIYIICCTNLL